jgi:hypothetical protein
LSAFFFLCPCSNSSSVVPAGSSATWSYSKQTPRGVLQISQEEDHHRVSIFLFVIFFLFPFSSSFLLCW